jgi:hypothetical protein
MGDEPSPSTEALQAAIAALDAEVMAVQAMSMSGSIAALHQQNFDTQFAELEKDLEETAAADSPADSPASSPSKKATTSVRCNRPVRKMQAAEPVQSIFDQLMPTPPKSPRIRLSPIEGGMKKPPEITRGDAIDILNRLEAN